MKYTECLGYECPIVWKTRICPECGYDWTNTPNEDKVRCNKNYVICIKCQGRCMHIDNSEPENNDAIVGKVVFVDHV